MCVSWFECVYVCVCVHFSLSTRKGEVLPWCEPSRFLEEREKEAGLLQIVEMTPI